MIGHGAEQFLVVPTAQSLSPIPSLVTVAEGYAMLEYMRSVWLYLTGVRLVDMYTFSVQSPDWDPGAVTVTAPPAYLPFPIP